MRNAEMNVVADLKDPAHACRAEDVLGALHVDAHSGLSRADAAARQAEFGPNLLTHRRPAMAVDILIHQFSSAVVILLAIATAVSLAYGEVVEAIAIGVVLAVNAAIGFVTEIRAIRSMEALRRLGAVTTRIRRDSRMMVVPAQELVPGDIVILEGGDVVTADLRLIEAPNLAADESTLTGESVPVAKSTEPDPVKTPLADIRSMVFKGTAITRGGGTGVVVSTGVDTQLGRISALVEEAKPERSPLEKQLDRLASHLIWVTLLMCAAIGAFGVLSGGDTFLMIEAAIALAVAAIPEGLPIVATMALARGMWRMARENALIERLSAVETLGATTIIFTDKTGTLTENRLSVRCVALSSGTIDLSNFGAEAAPQREQHPLDPSLVRALSVAVLCNNAELGEGNGDASGDPIEVALLRAGVAAGLKRAALMRRTPRIGGVAFESETAKMATVHRSGEAFLFCVKGAPEAVLEHSDRLLSPSGEVTLEASARKHWLERTRELAEDGLRVLAVAEKVEHSDAAAPYEGLVFLGLIGLSDPPRKDVPAAIGACRDAGIRVVMLTGDHAVTAQRVAAAIGLPNGDTPVIEGRDLHFEDELEGEEKERVLSANVFARISPAQKLELVALHQARGEIVAMTGDGVNDAPALKQADIGVAMGMRGTQVAKQAAAMVLTDDAFATIVHAIREGRVIFRNIQRFVAYLLSCNLSEILIVGLAVLAGLPLPLLPLQILFLNMVTDVFPAFALGVGAGSDGILDRPPRNPAKPILTRPVWVLIIGTGLTITAATLGAFLIALNWLSLDGDAALTVSFLTLAFAQLWNTFNMRDPDAPILRNDITRNPFVWAALVLCTGLLLLAVYMPVLSETLHLTRLGPEAWSLVIGLSILPVVITQIGKSVLWNRRAQAKPV
jgi:Ca2+-transporting ATPase